jgi:HEAT repeat protein
MKTNDIKIDLKLDEFSKEVSDLIPDLVSNRTTKRQNARMRLSKISPLILDQLAKLITSKNKQLRWEVAKSLEDRSSLGSIPILLTLLADEESDIRWLAAEGLINIGRESVIPLLHEIIYNESIYIREGAHHVLHSLLTGKERRDYHQLMRALKHNKSVKGTASLKAKEVLDSFGRRVA